MTGGRHARKEAARRHLLDPFDGEAVLRWAAAERQATAILQSLLFDEDELVRWRAVEALGRVAALRAERGELESVRELVRRTLWLMNDESGGLLWNGPEVMGAVLASVPALCGELLEILASFLEEDPFRVGTRWALWRVASVRPQAVAAAAAGPLASSLADPDPAVRGHTALALAATSESAAKEAAAVLAHDDARLVVFDYRTSALRSVMVRDAAAGAF